MSLDVEVVEYIYRERGIDPAYIEKDWYAVNVLKAVSVLRNDSYTPIFSGGTSLSKGYGLIQRFSEDLDFRIRFESPLSSSQGRKRAFRQSVVELLQTVDGVECDPEDVDSDGLGFRIPLSYQRHFETPEGMRPDLRLEFRYTQPRLTTYMREIASFVSEYKNETAEASMWCLSPVEIAADKFSGLVWRVLKRNRDLEGDDPALARHLHDLCALRTVIADERAAMADAVTEAFAEDQGRANRRISLSLVDGARKAAEKMRQDSVYVEEYSQFVDAMSYANDDERIDFQKAIDSFEELIDMCS